MHGRIGIAVVQQRCDKRPQVGLQRVVLKALTCLQRIFLHWYPPFPGFTARLEREDRRIMPNAIRRKSEEFRAKQGKWGSHLPEVGIIGKAACQYRTPNVSVGTVKKSIAAMASRWFLRNVSHRFTGCGSLGARRIHRETLLSETSKPSLSSSP